MDYAEFTIPADLNGVVRCVWTLSGSPEKKAHSEPILPDGCPELILNRGLPFDEQKGKDLDPQPQRFLHGQLTRAFHLRPRGPSDMVGVRLQPHGAYVLFGAKAVVVDTKVELFTLSKGVDEAFADALGAADPVKAVIGTLRSLPHHPVERAITDLITAIESNDDETRLSELKASAALSARQLERRFLAVVGLRPKAYARIVRLRRSIELLHSGDTASFAEYAHAAGYYDQAHFNRDFKAFTGLSPRVYFGQELSLPAYFSGVA